MAEMVGPGVVRRVLRGRWRPFAAAAAVASAGVVGLGALAGCTGGGSAAFVGSVPSFGVPSPSPSPVGKAAVLAEFDRLKVRSGPAPSGYSPDLFGKNWGKVAGSSCTADNFVLTRDLTKVAFKDGATCVVTSGALFDPYTGRWVWYERSGAPSGVGIDHVVGLADAWASGLYQWNSKVLTAFANDPAELVAASSAAIAARNGADAASWLPPDTADRCAYVATQIKIKAKYYLTLSGAEHDAMAAVLAGCPQSWTSVHSTSAPPPPPPPSSSAPVTLQAHAPAVPARPSSARPAAVVVAQTATPTPTPSPSPSPSPFVAPSAVPSAPLTSPSPSRTPPPAWPARHTGRPTSSPTPTPTPTPTGTPTASAAPAPPQPQPGGPPPPGPRGRHHQPPGPGRGPR